MSGWVNQSLPQCVLAGLCISTRAVKDQQRIAKKKANAKQAADKKAADKKDTPAEAPGTPKAAHGPNYDLVPLAEH